MRRPCSCARRRREADRRLRVLAGRWCARGVPALAAGAEPGRHQRHAAGARPAGRRRAAVGACSTAPQRAAAEARATSSLALTGSTMLSLEGAPYGREWIVARNVNGGPRARSPGRSRTSATAGGGALRRHLEDQQGHLLVLNWRSAARSSIASTRAAARTRSPPTDGRDRGASSSASRPRSPRDPRLRRSPGQRGALPRWRSRERRSSSRRSSRARPARIVLLRPDGRRARSPPRMPLGGGGVAFDGHTLAFVSGPCVYAGPIPATTPTDPPPPCS